MAKKKKTKLKPFKFIPCCSPEKICGLRLPDGGEILISYDPKKTNTKHGQWLGILTVSSQTTDFDALKVVKKHRCINSVKIRVGFDFQ